MNKFCIITNSGIYENKDMAKHIKDYFHEHGASCTVMENRLTTSAAIRHFTDVEKIPDDTECAIVLGGDGTLVQAAIDLVHIDVPILGVNMGNLGFLTEVEHQNVDSALERLLNDDFQIESRMMLKEISHFKQPDSRSSCYALNDIVVSKRGGKPITVRVFLNNDLVDIYTGDGVLISTPTGATGYNLSAGGPVMAPHLRAMVVTPICPHSLNKRSLVVDAADSIRLEVGQTRASVEDLATVSADGRLVGEIITDDALEIAVPHAVTKLVKLSPVGFYERMREKLNGN